MTDRRTGRKLGTWLRECLYQQFVVWSTVLLEKLIVAQLVKKLSPFK